MKALLDAKADINAVDSDGNNALTLAILNTHYDLAQMLIDRGADPNIAAKNGRTALYSAVEMHDVDWSPRPAHKETDKTTSMDIIHALLDHKANVNAQLTAPAPIEKHAQDMGDTDHGSGHHALYTRRSQRRCRADASVARQGRRSEAGGQGQSNGADGGRRAWPGTTISKAPKPKRSKP